MKRLIVLALISTCAYAACPDLVSIAVTRWVDHQVGECRDGRCEIVLDDSTEAYTETPLPNWTPVKCHVHVSEGVHCWAE
jgi:hypothetical protein